MKPTFTLKKFSIYAAAASLLLASFGVEVSAQTRNPNVERTDPNLLLGRPATIVGIVAGAPERSGFNLRSAGTVYRVRPFSINQMAGITGGDEVRVFGYQQGLILQNASVRLLQVRASAVAADYDNNDTGALILPQDDTDATGTNTAGTGTAGTGAADGGTEDTETVATGPGASGTGATAGANAGPVVATSRTSGTPGANALSQAILRGVTRTGSVLRLGTGNQFTLRAAGRDYQVRANGGRTRGLAAGNRVRVYGNLQGNQFTATNMRILR